MRKRNFIKIAFTISLLAAIALLAAACGSSKAENTESANANAAPTVVDVTTAQAIVRELPVYFEATGTLASDAQTDVAPAVGGKIVQVNFDVGSYVQKNSVLVQLDDRDARIRLEQAQAQVEQAKSNVNQAKSQVEQAKANLRQTQAQLGLQNGGSFDVNQVAEVKTARAALELAEKQLRRSENLLETGDVARAVYDQAKAARDQAAAQYQAAINAANQRYAAINAAQAQVNTAQAAVRTAQSAVDAAQTQTETARKAIADATVLAPISGYVSDKVADVGEYASPQSKIATILRTSILRLKIEVPEHSIGKVAVGQSVSIQTSAYPDRNFAGTIVRIAPNLNATSRTLIVEAEVENSEGLLKPGQFATVRIAQSKPQPTVMIPVSAVKAEGDTNKAYVVQNGRAEERIIKTGILENDYIAVQNGIQEGETVATSNMEKLYDGVAVR